LQDLEEQEPGEKDILPDLKDIEHKIKELNDKIT
jgi:hypothetical protein